MARFGKRKTGISTSPWVMGSFDGAETCEIVGLYMLNQLQQCIPTDQIGAEWNNIHRKKLPPINRQTISEGTPISQAVQQKHN